MTARSALDCFFMPRSVAVIGATDRQNSVGRTVLANLASGKFSGAVYAVNPHHPTVLGMPCYANIAAIPQKVDLAIVVTPAPSVPAVIRECVDAAVRSAIVISAGFKERGAEGAALEAQIQAELRRGSLRLLGPNCLGLMNPAYGLNATFASDIARPGNVAFLSQSGALLTAILDWSLEQEVGFSAIVSTGSMLDVSWGDLISFFADDPADAQHSPVHGIDWRCARLSFRGSRSHAAQAGHRHQGGALGGGGTSSQLAHRSSHR